jgi:hypothetical protein
VTMEGAGGGGVALLMRLLGARLPPVPSRGYRFASPSVCFPSSDPDYVALLGTP